MGANLGAKAVGRVFNCGQEGGGWRERSQSSSVLRGASLASRAHAQNLALVLTPHSNCEGKKGRVELLGGIAISSVGGKSVRWQNIGSSGAAQSFGH